MFVLRQIIKNTNPSVLAAAGAGEVLARELPGYLEHLHQTRRAIEALGPDELEPPSSVAQNAPFGFIRDGNDRRSLVRDLENLGYLMDLFDEAQRDGDHRAMAEAAQAIERIGTNMERVLSAAGYSVDQIGPGGTYAPPVLTGEVYARASWLHGAWTYRTSGGFKDTHELLSDGRTRQGGTWSVRDGKLVIEWPNGYLNEYPLQGPTRRLTGETISPGGRRQESWLRRRDDWTASVSPGASWLHGAWTYRTSGGFKDTHELLSDGRTRQGGTWSVRDGKLVIEWPNGYLNEYPVQGPTRRLTGETISPSGRRQESSLRRRDD